MQNSQSNPRRYNVEPPKQHPAAQGKVMHASTQKFILECMKENDTLTIRKGCPAEVYFEMLMVHHQEQNCSAVRLEALASAIPNLVKVAEMLELAGVGEKTKVRVKTRRLNVGNTTGGNSCNLSNAVLCKFLPCIRVDFRFATSEN